jgi:hypothetical protein
VNASLITGLSGNVVGIAVVPEPSTFILMGFGSAMLFAGYRRVKF